MIDWTAVISGLVVAVFGFAGVLVTNTKNHKENILEIQSLFKEQNADQEQRFQKHILEIKSELSRYEAVNDQKIATLTKQVEKHNNVVERMYKLEQKVAVLEAKNGGNSEKE